MFFKTQTADRRTSRLRKEMNLDEESCSIVGDPVRFHNALLGSRHYRSGNLYKLLAVTTHCLTRAIHVKL
jgi:hypothetical protein